MAGNQAQGRSLIQVPGGLTIADCADFRGAGVHSVMPVRRRCFIDFDIKCKRNKGRGAREDGHIDVARFDPPSWKQAGAGGSKSVRGRHGWYQRGVTNRVYTLRKVASNGDGHRALACVLLPDAESGVAQYPLTCSAKRIPGDCSSFRRCRNTLEAEQTWRSVSPAKSSSRLVVERSSLKFEARVTGETPRRTGERYYTVTNKFQAEQAYRQRILLGRTSRPRT